MLMIRKKNIDNVVWQVVQYNLSKVFDCVQHDTLVRNLDLDFLKSFLKDRVQMVDVNATKSSGSKVSMGVPHG